MQHVDLVRRFEQLNVEVELGFSAEQTAREVQRCLNCDIETEFAAKRCIECDACIDICPVQCLTITRDGAEPELRERLSAPPATGSGDLRLRAAAPDRAGHGQGRRCLCALWVVCGTMPDCSLGHAEIRSSHAVRRKPIANGTRP